MKISVFFINFFAKISIFLLLNGCSSPVYQNTTYDIEEFVADSNRIAQGKQAILELEDVNDEASCPVEFRESFEEIIEDGDELTIALYYPQRQDHVSAIALINQTTGFRVSNGKICLPNISSIEVKGMTLNEIRKKVQTAYCDQLPNAQVFINFKKRYEQQVQIIGAGKSMVTVDGRMRLSEVLAKAKVPPHANLFKSYVMREGQKLPLDLYKLIHEGDERQNIVMRGGDQIFMAKMDDASVMVTGEVFKPMIIPIPYGFISLREALVTAGGIPFTGDKGCIQIIRGNLPRPKIYCLVWEEITRLPNQSLWLMPGDVVVISEKPITQWNRFIDQVQPSLNGMQGAYSTYWLFNEILK